MRKIFTKDFLKIKSSKNQYDVILHIGAPKTGTSAIQNFLLNSRKALLKEGVYYPYHDQDQNNISGGHSKLGTFIAQGDVEHGKKLFLEYLNKAKKTNKILLLSSESFYFQVDTFFKIISSYKVKIIVFERNRIESIISLYNQGVKRHFQTHKLSDVCQDILNRNNPPMDNVIERWKEKFNAENITVISYSKAQFMKKSIEEVFLVNLNLHNKVIERLKPVDIKMINKSYGYAELELKRVLNIVLDRQNNVMNNWLDLFLQRLSDLKQTNDESVELSDELLKQLQKKFNVSEVFIELNQQKKRDVCRDIFNICDLMEKNENNLYLYIRQCLEIYTKRNVVFSKDVEALLKWFDISYKPLQYQDKFFTQFQLNQMSIGKYKEADFLRDISLVLIAHKDYVNAEKLIARASKIRPDGPVIQQIKEIIKKEILKESNDVKKSY
ncbi:MAG TPA: hypothetical protein ENK66_09675 [Arcobacter sp.]|nr:hypothetical protein [Arcobacter sp.]